MPEEITQGELKALIHKATEDARLFELLVRHLDNKVFAFCSGRLRDRDIALMTTQDIFVELWRALPQFSYRSDAEFYSFLFTIARRKIARQWKEKVHVALEDIFHLQDDTSEEVTEDYTHMLKRLRKLDDVTRDIITLRYWSEFSFGDIASILHLKEDTVRMRHHRGLKKLKELLPMYA